MGIRKTLNLTHSCLLATVIVVVIIITLVAISERQRILIYTTNFKPGLTLARIGSDLEFDYTTCPPSSAMLNFTQTTPLHDDCPHVFIIGARKGGTTSLYHYLSSHPDFSGVNLKAGPTAGETFYFERRYKKISWRKYVSKFPTDKMSGDSSVGNLAHCSVPKRLYSNCGHATKVIVLLRDPLERFQSNFRMRVRLRKMYSNHAYISISSVVDKEINVFNQQVSLLKSIETSDLSSYPSGHELRGAFCIPKNMVFDGLYYVHLHNWLCNFPAENILILNTEQFYDFTVESLATVMDFVGLRPLTDYKMKNIASAVYNYGGGLENELSFRKLNMQDRKKLMAIYESFNNKLFQLLEWNSVKWNNLSE